LHEADLAFFKQVYLHFPLFQNIIDNEYMTDKEEVLTGESMACFMNENK